jgi:hypothetical protein
MPDYHNNKGSFQDDTTHIYYNLSIYNNNTGFDANGRTTQTAKAIPANYNINRTNPYLYHPNEYDTTVVRMAIDNNSLPLQLVQPELGKSFETLPSIDSPDGFTYNLSGIPTIYEIYVENTVNGKSREIFVHWKSEDVTLTPPTVTTKSNMNSEYFYNYYVESFINAVNDALAYAVADCTVNIPPKTNSKGTIPYFSYENKKISFNAPITWMTDVNGNNTYQNLPDVLLTTDNFIIELNEPLYNLFDGLEAQEFKYNPTGPTTPEDSPNNAYKLLVIPSIGNTNIIPQYQNVDAVPLVQTGNYIKVTQEWSSISLWNCVKSIIFKTAFLQIVNEMNAEPLVAGTNPNIYNLAPTEIVSGYDASGNAIYINQYPCQVNNADVSPTLFEFALINREEPESSFSPAGEYLLTSMLCLQPISELNIQTLWKDSFGNLHPVVLEPASSLSLKILFRKKDYRITKA